MGKARYTSLGGEISPGQVAVATGEIGDQTAFLISLDDGKVRRIGQHLQPASRWPWFHGAPNSVSPPGAPASTLFQTDEGSLVRVDPETGARDVLLGESAN